jgi:hypothetical protein
LSEEDKALNSLIGAKEYLTYLQLKLDYTFKEVWAKTIKPTENE